jgi:ATP-binding cassette subfamily C protein CydC
MACFESANALPSASQTFIQSIEAGRNLFAFDQKDECINIKTNISDELLSEIVRMDRVSFSRGDGEFDLCDISLELEAGKKLALVGPSGAGKSSIVELLLKISEPDSGRIRIGEKDYSSLDSNQVREIFGVIGHGDFLFNNSLKENLLIAKPFVSDGELWDAIKSVRLDGWAKKLPEKLDTWLGNHGTAVSGGEFQRIMLARQILLDRPVLIMDEPLISLDHAVKHEFFGLVNSRFAERAILWISHEFLFMEEMDEILYLENGRILERGTHTELMNKQGSYFLTYSMQRGIEL